MKILHTSDWHLGHQLYGYERGEEQTAMIEKMIEIVTSEKPDLFLLSGDVYHLSQPSAMIQTLLSEAIMRLHMANPFMTIVITAGNHDSGTRHEVFKTPWKHLNVHVIGTIDRDDPENHIIKVSDKGFVLALPYSSNRNLPDGFIQQLLSKTDVQNSTGLPVILCAHTTVLGCDFSGHIQATERNVGGIDALSIEEFGTGYDYLALGHIHKPQFIHTGRHNVRYCGTPVPISFDEKYPHSVSIVEIQSHGQPPIVREIEIPNPRPLVTLPSDGACSWDEAKNLLRDFPSDIPAYIRLNVLIEDFLPPLAQEEAISLTQGKQCHFCCINAQRAQQKELRSQNLTVSELQEIQPIDLFRKYLEDIGSPIDENKIRLFQEAELAINQEND